ncbi:MAG: DUF1592 domain-containing protein, partial [Planctomycetales bacterium]
MMHRVNWILIVCTPVLAVAAEPPSAVFQREILPPLQKYCGDCHGSDDSENDVRFLDVKTVSDLQADRSVWRSVAVQLRNRTMPPPDCDQPSDQERSRIAGWIRSHLRETACSAGPWAGTVKPRRLNRLEYDRTVQQLFGVDLKFRETLPPEGGTGEGFDNSGDSLFLPPILMERYLEAAQAIVDAAIQTPRLTREFRADDLLPKEKGDRRRVSAGRPLTAAVTIYVDDGYQLTVAGRKEKGDQPTLVLRIDGVAAHRRKLPSGSDSFQENFDLRLARGLRAIELSVANDAGFSIDKLRVRQFEPQPLDKQARENHIRLTGTAPGEKPDNPRRQAEAQLQKLLPLAFRRPVQDDEAAGFMKLVDRGLRRGDPHEEALKLAYRGVLVSPAFLFRIESPPSEPGIQPLSGHELATRLSYFLWSAPPDARLRKLADDGELQDDRVLAKEVDRMLRDEQARVFAKSFIGQWLGTKDVGGRVAPTANDVQKFYTPEIATDMRGEAVE